MEIILQFGIATGNLGHDFLRFLILLPIAIIFDLIIKAIKNRSKKDDSETNSKRADKQKNSDVDDDEGEDEDEDNYEDDEDDEDELDTE